MKKKKQGKNGFFVSNFHFGNCVQNTDKNRLEMNAFCMRFKTFFRDKFEKNLQKTQISSNFHFGNCVQSTGKTRLEMNAFCMRFETLGGDK